MQQQLQLIARNQIRSLEVVEEGFKRIERAIDELAKRTAATPKLHNRGADMVIIDDAQGRKCSHCGFLMATDYMAYLLYNQGDVCCSHECWKKESRG